MASKDDERTQRYFYRSSNTSRKHRQEVSAYLVERRFDSNVVARIEPLGLVNSRIGEHEIALRGLRRNLVSIGTWQPTRSLRHSRIKVRNLRH